MTMEWWMEEIVKEDGIRWRGVRAPRGRPAMRSQCSASSFPVGGRRGGSAARSQTACRLRTELVRAARLEEGD